MGQFRQQTVKLYSIFEHNRRLKNNRNGQKWPKSALALTSQAYRWAQSYKNALKATEALFVWFGRELWYWQLKQSGPNLCKWTFTNVYLDVFNAFGEMSYFSMSVIFDWTVEKTKLFLFSVDSDVGLCFIWFDYMGCYFSICV